MKIFIHPRLYWIPAALPFLRLGETIFPKTIRLERLSGMKAGLLRQWQQRLAESNRTHAGLAAYFSERLKVRPAAGMSHPYLRLPLFAASPAARERIVSASKARGLGVGVAYPRPISEIPDMTRVVNGQRFPAARQAAATLLTIPTHEWVSDRDRRAIVELCGGIAEAS